jgi:hypothetical protein
MTTEQKEKLREVLIDYLQVLTSTSPEYPQNGYDKIHNQRIAEVRLLLREVA